MGHFQRLNPKQSPSFVSVDAQDAFPMNTKKVRVDRTGPNGFRWFEDEGFPLYPALGFTLHHDPHRSKKEAATDFLAFHGRILTTCGTVIQPHFPVMGEFSGQTRWWLPIGFSFERFKQNLS